MIFAKVFKEKPQTKQKTSKPFYRWKIKRRNWDRNSYCSLIRKEKKKKSHNFKPPNRPTQAQRKEQMQAKWGHRPDWKFRDFKPLDRLFTKRCLWLRATSFYLQSFINHKRKISWSFLFFFHFCDANLNALSPGHNLWNQHKKEVLDKHFIFHGLRHFNFQPCFNSTLKWNATNFDGWFWCVDSRFFKTASFQPWIFFALYFSSIFFLYFFQYCLPPFFCSQTWNAFEFFFFI